MGVAPRGRPVVTSPNSWKLWLRLVFALGWLLLVSTIAFAPRPPRPADEPPVWKLVVWIFLFFTLLPVIVFVWKGT